MTRWLLSLVALCLLTIPAYAQTCHKAVLNRQGSSGADITVSTSAVTVLAANTERCRAIIFNNAAAANTMRCHTTLTPTNTVGYLIPGGASLEIFLGAKQQWQCIRAAAADATVSTLEEVP